MGPARKGSMKPSLITLLATLPLLTFAAEFDFAEKFADPATRVEALTELVPGTRDWFFHTALHQQLTGDTAAFERTLADWRAASERKQQPVPAQGFDSLATRELLLRYEADPEKNLAALIKRLDLQFDDSRPDAHAIEKLPDTVDPALISDEAFEKGALARHPDEPWRGLKSPKLLAALDQVDSFSEARLRHSLSSLYRADHPGVVRLISRGLALKPPVAFGESPVHRQLTLAQLEELQQLHPDLQANLSFVTTWLEKLRRHTGEDFARQPRLHTAHMERLREATADLPPALVSLKAHILHHLLRLQLENSEPKLDDFLVYLAIPRPTHELLKTDAHRNAPPIDLSTDFAKITGCPSVSNDAPLIRELLQHFLAKRDSADRFTPFIPHHILTPIHARARLLAGADPERWGKLLDPSEFATLRQQTRLEFAPGRPVLLSSDAAVTLGVDLKNTPELLIRIHELDLPGILARDGREPDVNLDLAGLVPHHTRTLTFDQPPLVLHRETIDLPELTGPGAWIVELVGNGHSSRALIRKGSLIPYLDRRATGQTLRVFDENGHPVTDATLDFGFETFTADASGTIAIPNAEHGPARYGVLSRGPLATLVRIRERTDQLKLISRVHLDREQLRADAEARARIQLRLTNHGHELPLDRIENARLTLSAKLSSGVTTEHVVSDDLQFAPVFTVPFQIPADTVSLTLKLDATVVPRENADPVELTTSNSFQFNHLLNGGFAHAHLIATTDGHFLELRGRNGEPLPDRALQLTFRRDTYVGAIELRLRTDDNGRIRLGSLADIQSLDVDLDRRPLLHCTENDLRPKIELPTTLRITPDEAITLPLQGPLNRIDYSFFALDLTDRPKTDLFEQLAHRDGQLEITGLAPGSYRLTTPDSRIAIEVLAATEEDGLLLSPQLIAPHLPGSVPNTLAAAVDGDTLTVRLDRPSESTRVHLIGTRFLDSPWNDRPLLPFSPVARPVLRPGFEACGFLTDQTLDEETRYILERRNLTPYPGTMLPRPGLLAHRWSEKDSSGDVLPPLPGMDGETESQKRSARHSYGDDDPFAAGGGGGASTLPDFLDYLARSSELHYDLTPAEDGTVSLPLATFDGYQTVRVVVTDENYYERRIIPLPESPIQLRDRRLARPLDPGKHHVGTRRATALMKDAEAVIDNMLDADWRAFTTLEEAHAFLFGTTGSDRLREMAGLLDWPDFDQKAKLAFWTDHACHELHLFLSRRDPEFFEKYIKPTLEQKFEPTFIDDYLLGRDLTAYLRPFAWERLNAAEKALLARSLPEARPRILSELEHRWQLEAPAPEQETQLFTQTLRGTDLAITDSLGLARNEIEEEEGDSRVMKSAGSSYILQKISNIVIPEIDFKDISVAEAIDFLRVQSIELDTFELDPAKKGVNFFVRGPAGNQRIAELKLRNAPLSEALNYICEATRCSWSVDDFAVTVKPATEVGEDLFTRTFRVPPDFLSRIGGYEKGDAPPEDPFQDPDSRPDQMTLTDALRANGVKFPPDATASYFAQSGTLLVRNTPMNLDLVDAIISSAVADKGAGMDIAPRGAVPGFTMDDSDETTRYQARQSWSADRPQTRIWSESNYDHHRSTDTGESLIPLNAFWLDLARWDGNGPFISPHFNACTASHNDALMCLALLDLPFKAGRPEVRTDGPTLRVKAREPMLLFYKDTRETDKVAADSPVLVRHTFHRLDDRFRNEAGRRIENTITGDFRTGTAYGASLVITNPTGAGRRIDVLAQIPAGAIALGGKETTLSETRELEPYGVLTFDLAFYFPEPGDFATYPLHVAEADTILATAPPRTLRVTDGDPAEDHASWKVIARDGSDDDVLARLASENLHAIDLGLIAWRLRDRGFYDKAIATLRERLTLPQSLARYAFLHGDTGTMSTWLENSDLALNLGEYLTSPLLDIRPTIHCGWQSLEFDPLVNPRAHRLGDRPPFHQELAHKHYRGFLNQLAWKPVLSADDQLHLTWFLFLQDRIGEGIARFAEIDRSQVATPLAYDYLHCLVLFHQAKSTEAAQIARTHPDLPPGPWAARFAAVISQAGEITALAENPSLDGEENATADAAPALEISATADGQLQLTHRHLQQVELSLYQIDLEMLFSRNPFLQDAGELPGTRPNFVQKLDLTGDTTRVELPEEFRRGNVLVSADASGTKALRILDSRALQIACRPVDPVLRVRTSTGAPVSAAYVKVYCERDGEPEFLKDGYTDLRGKFDYRTLTDDTPPATGRLAILITHPNHGSRTLILE